MNIVTGLKTIYWGIHLSLSFMRGKYEIVNLSTTRDDVSFTFQRYNDYTGLT